MKQSNRSQQLYLVNVSVVIMNGKNPDLLYDLFDNKQVGTLFLAKNGKGVTA